MRISVATDPGLVRENNQDSLRYAFLASGGLLLAVADGVAGLPGGQRASTLAVEILFREMGKYPEAGLDPFMALPSAVFAAHRQLREHPTVDGHMATTLTAALVVGSRVTAVHIGDSRLYRYRDGQLERLSRDHSVPEEMVRRGEISPDEALEHPQRHVLTRALGAEEGLEPDVIQTDLVGGDALLLCTDGLTTALSEAEIAEILGAEPGSAQRLVDLVNQRGGPDNVTVLLVEFEGGDLGG